MKIAEKWAKICIFPPVAILLLLLPIATAFLVYSMLFIGKQSPIAIISYVLAAYTLTIWCARIPQIIRFVHRLENESIYIQRWRQDIRLRTNTMLYGSFAWNGAYAIFQLWLGLYHASFWYYSMATYYVFLAVMRFNLARYTRHHLPGKNMKAEQQKYRHCGISLLIMNSTLALIIFFMVYWDRTFHHHEITTIALAAYTFTTFTFAIINTVKYRRYNSPVLSASKAISLAATCVSMLTLTSTMLTTFGGDDTRVMRKLMLGSLGTAVSLFIIGMALYMIKRTSESIKEMSFTGETAHE